MCIFYFLNSNVFFAFAIIEYKKFRRPGNFFFPLGEKNFLVCSSFGLGRLSSFFGGGRRVGGKEVNEKASTYHAVSICICVVVIRKLVRDTQSIRGIGSTEVNEKSSTYHAVSICILLLDTLCVRNYVNLLLGSTTQSIRGMGSKGGNEKSSTYHAVSICVLLLDTLCVRNYVNLLLSRRRSINMLML